MAGGLQLEIVTPEKLVFSGEVEYVTAPGGMGEFTVLPNHTPLLTSIVPGVVRFSTGGAIKELAVGWGYAEVRPYKMLILVEFAEGREDIDPQEVQRQVDEISAKLRESLSEEEKEALQKQLRRLLARRKLVA